MTSGDAASAPLDRLRRREQRRRVAGTCLDGLAGALLGGAAAARAGGGPWVGVAGALVGGGAAAALDVWRRRARMRPAPAEVARHLDATVPAAAWSAELLAASPRSLRLLERLQRERVAAALTAVRRVPLPHGTWAWPLARLAVAAAVAAVLLLASARQGEGRQRSRRAAAAAVAGAAQSAEIARLRVEVDPPAYTRLAPHFAVGWAVRAEEGALVKFEVEVRGAITASSLRFGEDELPLVPGKGGTWRGERRAWRSEIYSFHAVDAGREVLRGPLARLAVTPDQPPSLQVIRPQPLTLVPAGSPGMLAMEVAAQDDYGVAGVDASLVVAHGSGEQVTFREVHLPLGRRADGRFAGTLDLARAGFAADVEGYLRFEARDNRAPEPGRTRSATLRIRAVQPGERPTNVLGGGIVLPALPEMFRSERQIIIDTQRLLSDALHLPAAELERRAAGIGFDQRALRLRYGALLGEEVESGVAVEAAAAEVREAGQAASAAGHAGHEAGAGVRAAGGTNQAAAPGELEEDHDEPAQAAGLAKGAAGAGGDRAAALASALPEGMVHLHDSAESAAFFPDELRQEMRRVLTEMWGAEGRLRGAAPRAALPFEERALRQLKDVQQRSRVYVPKAAFEAPEIDPARRLTGDLAGVEAQRAQRAAPPADSLRELLAWSQAACGTPPPQPPGAASRAAGEKALEKAALAGDGEALDALAVWRAAARPGCAEARALAAPLWRLLAPPPPAVGRSEAER